MQQPPNSSRRQFLGLAGGAAVLGAIPVVTVRPAEATPAMLASAIQSVTGGAAVRTGKVKLDIPTSTLPGPLRWATAVREARRSAR